MLSIPIIQIDSKKAHKLDISIALRKIYYQPNGYQRTAKKLHEASLKAGYNFSIDEIYDWLEKQALYQIHKPRPKFIPRASFNSIQIPNECHQADILYMPHDTINNITYKYCLCIVDVASRFKWAVPLIDKTSSSVAKAFKKVYSNSKCPLIWPKLLMVDPGSEFKSDCKELMDKYNVKIKVGTSHRSQSIVERFNRTLAEKLFRLQDASDLLLPISKRSRAWVRNLYIIIDNLNNSVTRLIGMAPAKAIKMKQVISSSSKIRNGPMGFDESKLSYNTPVRYLLEPGELEGGGYRATDMNWSPQVYHIKKSLIQKNQPILY
jgi:hypothetical protein